MKPQHAAIINPLKQKIETLISLHEKALTENSELSKKLQTLSEEQIIYKKEKEDLEAELYRQIGQLKVELEWLKKKSIILSGGRA